MEICLSSSITGQQQLLPSHGRTKLPKPAIHTISIYAYSDDVQNRTRMTIHPHFILFSLHPLFNSIMKKVKFWFSFLSKNHSFLSNKIRLHHFMTYFIEEKNCKIIKFSPFWFPVQKVGASKNKRIFR